MSNCKVHFAGFEQPCALPASRYANVSYSLYTAFPFICGTVGESSPLFYKKDSAPFNEYISMLVSEHKHVIMDSGLFTLMFGAKKGKKDGNTIHAWFNALCEFISKCVPKCVSCVEVDCQKVLSVDAAWKYRELMRDAFPDRDIINVFHLEDGLDGLERLSKFSRYIAVSVPELRIACKKKSLTDMISFLCRKIKSYNPSIRIHLLGCTEYRHIVPVNDIVYSSDSTSWLSMLKYPLKSDALNVIKQFDYKKHRLDYAVDTMFKGFPRSFVQHDGAFNTSVRWGIAMKSFLSNVTKVLGEQ